MAIQLQIRRGTTAENDVFTGAVGELTMDTDTNGVRVHDGTTAGGVKIPTEATADYVVEWQVPTDLNNYTWYRKYKSGWVEQGGRWTGSFSISAFGVVTTPVTLPVPMTDTTYQAFAMATAQVGLLAITNSAGAQNTTTTLNVVIKEVVNGSRTVTEFVWQVSGMAA